MINLQKLEQIQPKILLIGSHPGIIQSMLDFDYLAKKDKPSIVGIIATGRNYERFFFGRKEVLIPVFPSVVTLPETLKQSINLFLNVSSARRVLSITKGVFESLPNIFGGVIFAENVPEKHAIELYNLAQHSDNFIIGPASVGILLPNQLKLGAIGGIDVRQLIESHLFTRGDTAVFSSSGGMTNEIITLLTASGHRLSFALHFGGDRFPVIRPKDAFEIAEKDEYTKTIVYFGELGGTDEYEIAELLQAKQVTKQVICYIAGTISEYFETAPQFGHAKAMAKTGEETARAKRDALRAAGATVAESFSEFVGIIKEIPSPSLSQKERDTLETGSKDELTNQMDELTNRKHALITTTVSQDLDGQPTVLGTDLLTFAQGNSFAKIAASLFLGKQIHSEEVEKFVDFILRLAVDHGPYVSGAVNTIITARAGRDLVSSLATGLLTIGPRFGGATNQAASNWLRGVVENKPAEEFVEEFASNKQYISGIGHRKYRIDSPDPRVVALLQFTELLEKKRFSQFALAVQKVTTTKKGNLILNVDGAIAAVLLDLLAEKEGYSDDQLQKLVEQEFFNALFVLSRSVGFIAHFLDQKRLDEGLFRLPEELVAQVKVE